MDKNLDEIKQDILGILEYPYQIYGDATGGDYSYINDELKDYIGEHLDTFIRAYLDRDIPKSIPNNDNRQYVVLPENICDDMKNIITESISNNGINEIKTGTWFTLDTLDDYEEVISNLKSDIHNVISDISKYYILNTDNNVWMNIDKYYNSLSDSEKLLLNI